MARVLPQSPVNNDRSNWLEFRLPEADFGEIRDALGVTQHGREQFAGNANVGFGGH
jgi:hypothetical protein